MELAAPQVPAAELGGANALEDVCRRGFEVDAVGGYEVTHGALRKGHVGAGPALCVLCDVAVGRSAVLEPGAKRELPPGGYASLWAARVVGGGSRHRRGARRGYSAEP